MEFSPLTAPLSFEDSDIKSPCEQESPCDLISCNYHNAIPVLDLSSNRHTSIYYDFPKQFKPVYQPPTVYLALLAEVVDREDYFRHKRAQQIAGEIFIDIQRRKKLKVKNKIIKEVATGFVNDNFINCCLSKK